MCGFRIAGLYGVRVRPVPPAGSTSSKPVVETSLLHRTLPDELLHEVFMRMVPYWLGRAACVCRKWRYATRAPILWRNACLKTWQACSLLSQSLQAELCGNFPLDQRLISKNTYVLEANCEFQKHFPVWICSHGMYMRHTQSSKQSTAEVLRFSSAAACS